MPDTLDPKFLDKRTIQRYVDLGLLDEKAYERHVKSLPDLTEKSAAVETVMLAGDEAETEDESDVSNDEAELAAATSEAPTSTP